MKKRRQRANVKDRKISFGDFQIKTIGISVKKILIEVPNMLFCDGHVAAYSEKRVLAECPTDSYVCNTPGANSFWIGRAKR